MVSADTLQNGILFSLMESNIIRSGLHAQVIMNRVMLIMTEKLDTTRAKLSLLRPTVLPLKVEVG